MIVLHVTDSRDVCIAKVLARIGMKTSCGPIVRMTDKTIWTARADGSEWQHRVCDGRLPTTKRSYVRKSDYI